MRIVCEPAIDIIKKYESLQLTSYKCPAGVWTIGYGHTSDVVGEGQVITEDAALNLLKGDLIDASIRSESAIKTELNDNQFGAIISLVFNIGITRFKESTLLKKINEGDLIGAADEFPRWNKVKGEVLNGLTKRREDERLLFLS